MWSRLTGKSNDKDEERSSQSSRRKSDAPTSQPRRRSGSESIVSSTSTRRPARGDDRDRGFNPSSTAYASSSKSQYPATASASIASSYATASSNRPDDNMIPPGLIRNASLAEHVPRTEDVKDERDRPREGDRQRTRSASRERKHRKHRSRSLDRKDSKRDKGDREWKIKKGDTDRGVDMSGDLYQSTSRVGENSAHGSANFNAQVGSAAFTQFPGQYEAGMSGFIANPSRPNPTTQQHSPANFSSHVPDQFPGQFPSQSSAPYRPPLSVKEGGPGLAAEYYGDAGQSVAQQPGIRPKLPDLIIGAEPHLMAASPTSAPPVEPSASGGVGAAAEYFSTSGPNNQYTQSGTASTRPPKPSKPSKPVNDHKPSKSSSLSGPVATVGGAALGYTAAALNESHKYGPSTGSNSTSSYQQGSNIAGPNLGYTSQTGNFSSQNSYHTNSAPTIATVGAAAAGAAAGYVIGHQGSSSHVSQNQQYRPSHSISGDASGHISASSQRPSSQATTYVVSPSGKPHKPGKHSSQANAPLYVAGAASAAGLSAAHHHHHSSGHSSVSGSPYSSGNMAFLKPSRTRTGPLTRFVDFWKDHEGVARFEEYTQYIGVCKHCFSPDSSPRDAPRKHHYRRRGSQGKYGSSTRVDKESRYFSSDSDNRRRSRKSWLATGIAGYGLAKVGKSLFSQQDDSDDTYDTKSDRARRSSISVSGRSGTTSRRKSQRSRSKDRVETGITSDGKVYRKESHGSFGGSTFTTFDPNRRRSRSRSRSREHQRRSGLAGAALGAVVGASAIDSRSRRRSRSRSPKKKFVREKRRSREASPVLVVTGTKSDRKGHRSSSSSYVDISRTNQSKNSGLLGGFFTTKPEKRTRAHPKKKKGFFAWGNGSSSSSDSDLAFGGGFASRNQSRVNRVKERDRRDTEAIIGLGAAAAAIAANGSRKGKRDRRHADIVAVKSSKSRHNSNRKRGHKSKSSTSSSDSLDEAWESASDDDVDDVSSVDSGLAFGGVYGIGKKGRRTSQDSLTSESSGASKWGWRWGSKKKKQKTPQPEPKASHSSSFTGPAIAGLAGAAAGAALTSERRHDGGMSSTGSLPPLQRVYPVPTQDPMNFDVSRHDSLSSTQTQPLITSRPAPVPLQQPQPITPVSSAVYSDQPHYHPIYSAPSGPPVFAQGPYHVEPVIQASQSSRQEQPIHPHLTNEPSASETRNGPRRDSLPTHNTASREPSATSSKRRASTRDTSSGVRFDFTKEQAEKDERDQRRREKEDKERRERALRREAEEQAQLDQERENARMQRERREHELARERDEIARQAQERHNREQRENESKIAQRKVEVDRDQAARVRETSQPDKKQSVSWATPVAAGAFGAAVGSAVAKKRSETQNRAQPTVNNDYNQVKSEQVMDAKARESNRQVQIAKKAASKVIAKHEDYAAYFTPPELLNKNKEQALIRGPNADNDILSYQIPNIITIAPPTQPPYPPAYTFAMNKDGIDPSQISFPWAVPKLNLIQPTPPPSAAGSVKAASPRSASPILGPDEVEEAGSDKVQPSSTSSNVASYDPVTEQYVYDVPRSPSKVDKTTSSPLHETMTIEDITDDRPEEQSKRHQAPGAFPSAVPGHIPGAFEDDTDFAATLAAGLQDSGFDPSIVTDDPAYRRRESPPGSNSQKYAHRDASRAQQSQPVYGDDIEFAATLAAGLQDTGFDPSIVIDEPTFRRRESPPGSEGPGKPIFYARPFSQTVIDLGFASPETQGAQPQQGYILGELEQTPKADASRRVPGGFFEETTSKPDRRDKRASSKTEARMPSDTAAVPYETARDDTVRAEDIPPMKPSPTLSKREQRKKERARENTGGSVATGPETLSKPEQYDAYIKSKDSDEARVNNSRAPQTENVYQSPIIADSSNTIPRDSRSTTSDLFSRKADAPKVEDSNASKESPRNIETAIPTAVNGDDPENQSRKSKKSKRKEDLVDRETRPDRSHRTTTAVKPITPERRRRSLDADPRDIQPTFAKTDITAPDLISTEPKRSITKPAPETSFDDDFVAGDRTSVSTSTRSPDAVPDLGPAYYSAKYDANIHEIVPPASVSTTASRHGTSLDADFASTVPLPEDISVESQESRELKSTDQIVKEMPRTSNVMGDISPEGTPNDFGRLRKSKSKSRSRETKRTDFKETPGAFPETPQEDREEPKYTAGQSSRRSSERYKSPSRDPGFVASDMTRSDYDDCKKSRDRLESDEGNNFESPFTDVRSIVAEPLEEEFEEPRRSTTKKHRRDSLQQEKSARESVQANHPFKDVHSVVAEPFEKEFEESRRSKTKKSKRDSLQQESSAKESVQVDPPLMDMRSVVAEPFEEEFEATRRSKTKKSKRDSFQHEPSPRSSGQLTEPGRENIDEPKKSKRKSKRGTGDFEDTASVATAPADLDDYEDSKKHGKKDKKSGFFGLFGSNKSTDTVSESRKHKDTHRDAAMDDFEEPKRKSKKRSSAGTSSGSIYDVSGVAAQSLSNVSDVRSARASDRSRDDDDGHRSHKSRDRGEKRRSREETGRSTRDQEFKKADLKDTREAQNVVFAKETASSITPVSGGLESLQDKAKSSYEPVIQDVTPSRSALELQQDTTSPPYSRSIGSIDEVPIIASKPTSPPQIAQTEELPSLPLSQPGSPTMEEPRKRRPSSISTPDRIQTLIAPPNVPSPTAIPIHFRKPRPLSGSARSSPQTSPSGPDDSPISGPRQRGPRPTSTEFKTSSEFRPLWLVERHSFRQPEPELEYPPLPESRSESEPTSLIDPDENISSRALGNDFANDATGLGIGSEQHEPAQTLENEQSKVSSHQLEQQLTANQLPHPEAMALSPPSSPSRIVHSVKDLFPEHKLVSQSEETYNPARDLPPLPASRPESLGSSPSQTNEERQPPSLVDANAIEAILDSAATAAMTEFIPHEKNRMDRKTSIGDSSNRDIERKVPVNTDKIAQEVTTLSEEHERPALTDASSKKDKKAKKRAKADLSSVTELQFATKDEPVVTHDSPRDIQQPQALTEPTYNDSLEAFGEDKPVLFRSESKKTKKNKKRGSTISLDLTQPTDPVIPSPSDVQELKQDSEMVEEYNDNGFGAIEPDRPMLARTISKEKKGKKQSRKDKPAIPVITPVVYERNASTEDLMSGLLSAEEQKRLQEQDAQDAVDSWFDPPSPSTLRKNRKGKKARKSDTTLENIPRAPVSNIEISTDEPKTESDTKKPSLPETSSSTLLKGDAPIQPDFHTESGRAVESVQSADAENASSKNTKDIAESFDEHAAVLPSNEPMSALRSTPAEPVYSDRRHEAEEDISPVTSREVQNALMEQAAVFPIDSQHPFSDGPSIQVVTGVDLKAAPESVSNRQTTEAQKSLDKHDERISEGSDEPAKTPESLLIASTPAAQAEVDPPKPSIAIRSPAEMRMDESVTQDSAELPELKTDFKSAAEDASGRGTETVLASLDEAAKEPQALSHEISSVGSNTIDLTQQFEAEDTAPHDEQSSTKESLSTSDIPGIEEPSATVEEVVESQYTLPDNKNSKRKENQKLANPEQQTPENAVEPAVLDVEKPFSQTGTHLVSAPESEFPQPSKKKSKGKKKRVQVDWPELSPEASAETAPQQREEAQDLAEDIGRSIQSQKAPTNNDWDDATTQKGEVAQFSAGPTISNTADPEDEFQLPGKKKSKGKRNKSRLILAEPDLESEPRVAMEAPAPNVIEAPAEVSEEIERSLQGQRAPTSHDWSEPITERAEVIPETTTQGAAVDDHEKEIQMPGKKSKGKKKKGQVVWNDLEPGSTVEAMPLATEELSVSTQDEIARSLESQKVPTGDDLAKTTPQSAELVEETSRIGIPAAVDPEDEFQMRSKKSKAKKKKGQATGNDLEPGLTVEAKPLATEELSVSTKDEIARSLESQKVPTGDDLAKPTPQSAELVEETSRRDTPAAVDPEDEFQLPGKKKAKGKKKQKQATVIEPVARLPLEESTRESLVKEADAQIQRASQEFPAFATSHASDERRLSSQPPAEDYPVAESRNAIQDVAVEEHADKEIERAVQAFPPMTAGQGLEQHEEPPEPSLAKRLGPAESEYIEPPISNKKKGKHKKKEKQASWINPEADDQFDAKSAQIPELEAVVDQPHLVAKAADASIERALEEFPPVSVLKGASIDPETVPEPQKFDIEREVNVQRATEEYPPVSTIQEAGPDFDFSVPRKQKKGKKGKRTPQNQLDNSASVRPAASESTPNVQVQATQQGTADGHVTVKDTEQSAIAPMRWKTKDMEPLNRDPDHSLTEEAQHEHRKAEDPVSLHQMIDRLEIFPANIPLPDIDDKDLTEIGTKLDNKGSIQDVSSKLPSVIDRYPERPAEVEDLGDFSLAKEKHQKSSLKGESELADLAVVESRPSHIESTATELQPKTDERGLVTPMSIDHSSATFQAQDEYLGPKYDGTTVPLQPEPETMIRPDEDDTQLGAFQDTLKVNTAEIDYSTARESSPALRNDIALFQQPTERETLSQAPSPDLVPLPEGDDHELAEFEVDSKTNENQPFNSATGANAQVALPSSTAADERQLAQEVNQETVPSGSLEDSRSVYHPPQMKSNVKSEPSPEDLSHAQLVPQHESSMVVTPDIADDRYKLRPSGEAGVAPVPSVPSSTQDQHPSDPQSNVIYDPFTPSMRPGGKGEGEAQEIIEPIIEHETLRAPASASTVPKAAIESPKSGNIDQSISRDLTSVTELLDSGSASVRETPPVPEIEEPPWGFTPKRKGKESKTHKLVPKTSDIEPSSHEKQVPSSTIDLPQDINLRHPEVTLPATDVMHTRNSKEQPKETLAEAVQAPITTEVSEPVAETSDVWDVSSQKKGKKGKKNKNQQVFDQAFSEVPTGSSTPNAEQVIYNQPAPVRDEPEDLSTTIKPQAITQNKDMPQDAIEGSLVLPSSKKLKKGKKGKMQREISRDQISGTSTPALGEESIPEAVAEPVIDPVQNLEEENKSNLPLAQSEGSRAFEPATEESWALPSKKRGKKGKKGMRQEDLEFLDSPSASLPAIEHENLRDEAAEAIVETPQPIVATEEPTAKDLPRIESNVEEVPKTIFDPSWEPQGRKKGKKAKKAETQQDILDESIGTSTPARSESANKLVAENASSVGDHLRIAPDILPVGQAQEKETPEAQIDDFLEAPSTKKSKKGKKGKLQQDPFSQDMDSAIPAIQHKPEVASVPEPIVERSESPGVLKRNVLSEVPTVSPKDLAIPNADTEGPWLESAEKSKRGEMDNSKQYSVDDIPTERISTLVPDLPPSTVDAAPPETEPEFSVKKSKKGKKKGRKQSLTSAMTESEQGTSSRTLAEPLPEILREPSPRDKTPERSLLGNETTSAPVQPILVNKKVGHIQDTATPSMPVQAEEASVALSKTGTDDIDSRVYPKSLETVPEPTISLTENTIEHARHEPNLTEGEPETQDIALEKHVSFPEVGIATTIPEPDISTRSGYHEDFEPISPLQEPGHLHDNKGTRSDLEVDDFHDIGMVKSKQDMSRAKDASVTEAGWDTTTSQEQQASLPITEGSTDRRSSSIPGLESDRNPFAGEDADEAALYEATLASALAEPGSSLEQPQHRIDPAQSPARYIPDTAPRVTGGITMEQPEHSVNSRNDTSKPFFQEPRIIAKGNSAEEQRVEQDLDFKGLPSDGTDKNTNLGNVEPAQADDGDFKSFATKKKNKKAKKGKQQNWEGVPSTPTIFGAKTPPQPTQDVLRTLPDSPASSIEPGLEAETYALEETEEPARKEPTLFESTLHGRVEATSSQRPASPLLEPEIDEIVDEEARGYSTKKSKKSKKKQRAQDTSNAPAEPRVFEETDFRKSLEAPRQPVSEHIPSPAPEPEIDVETDEEALGYSVKGKGKKSKREQREPTVRSEPDSAMVDAEEPAVSEGIQQHNTEALEVAFDQSKFTPSLGGNLPPPHDNFEKHEISGPTLPGVQEPQDDFDGFATKKVKKGKKGKKQQLNDIPHPEAPKEVVVDMPSVTEVERAIPSPATVQPSAKSIAEKDQRAAETHEHNLAESIAFEEGKPPHTDESSVFTTKKKGKKGKLSRKSSQASTPVSVSDNPPLVGDKGLASTSALAGNPVAEATPAAQLPKSASFKIESKPKDDSLSLHLGNEPAQNVEPKLTDARAPEQQSPVASLFPGLKRVNAKAPPRRPSVSETVHQRSLSLSGSSTVGDRKKLFDEGTVLQLERTSPFEGIEPKQHDLQRLGMHRLSGDAFLDSAGVPTASSTETEPFVQSIDQTPERALSDEFVDITPKAPVVSIGTHREAPKSFEDMMAVRQADERSKLEDSALAAAAAATPSVAAFSTSEERGKSRADKNKSKKLKESKASDVEERIPSEQSTPRPLAPSVGDALHAKSLEGSGSTNIVPEPMVMRHSSPRIRSPEIESFSPVNPELEKSESLRTIFTSPEVVHGGSDSALQPGGESRHVDDMEFSRLEPSESPQVGMPSSKGDKDSAQNRDSALHVADSPMLSSALPVYNVVRDSGFHDVSITPIVEQRRESSPPLRAVTPQASRPAEQLSQTQSNPIADASNRAESSASLSSLHPSGTNTSSSDDHGLNISVELDPSYELSVSRHHQADSEELSRNDSEQSLEINWPPQDSTSDVTPGDQLRGRRITPARSMETLPQPSPVESTTRDRDSQLFESLPALIQQTTPNQSVQESTDHSQFGYEPHYMHHERGTFGHGESPDNFSSPVVPPRSHSPERDLPRSKDVSAPAHNQQPSLFGGPLGINSDRPAVETPKRGTPLHPGSERGPLNTITEDSPEQSPLHRKKSRTRSDVGSPDHALKAARRMDTAQEISHNKLRDSTIKSRGLTPSTQPGSTARDKKFISTDELISRLSWPSVDENEHTVDIERVKSRDTDRQSISRHSNSPAITVDPLKAREYDGRSTSGQSVRSTGSAKQYRTPEREQVRSASGLSNRSGGTPPLRRVTPVLSGDLRAANKRSRGSQARLAKENRPDVELDPRDPLESSSSIYDPVNDKGKERARDMAAVYEGWGDVHASPLSPTRDRPPSMRRRQSTQILDLESRLDQLISENRLLANARVIAEKGLEDAAYEQTRHSSALSEAIESRDLQLRAKDNEIAQVQEQLQRLQQEVTRLSGVNQDLTDANISLNSMQDERWHTLQAEHATSTRELEDLKQQHSELSIGMENIVRHEVTKALEEKNAELRRLRDELESAKEQVRTLQQQILASKPKDDFLVTRDEDYFDNACQELCQHVQQWVLRFSKFSDKTACHLASEVADEKVVDRFENAILDGSDVDIYLSDRVKRRDVFMSVVMTMIWEYVFTRYLFGMDREQRQKLKTLEKTLTEVGHPTAVAHWRATTLTLLSKRPAFLAQRAQDTEAVAQEIFSTLSVFLPPPSHLSSQILDSLRKVLSAAVDIAIAMRTQRAEYTMLPPLQPEYDTHGDLARKVYFNAGFMNERGGEPTFSNEELEEKRSVVRMVLFPLVLKKGSDEGEGDEELVVCPAQVLVARPPRDKKVVRVLSGGERSEGRGSSVEGGLEPARRSGLSVVLEGGSDIGMGGMI